jgi:hypothetical protein
MGGSRTAAKATKAAAKKDAGTEDEGPAPPVIENLSDMTQIKRVFEDTTIEVRGGAQAPIPSPTAPPRLDPRAPRPDL